MSDINQEINSFGASIANIVNNINYNPLCSILVNIIRNSIEDNFQAGGRYGNGLFGGGTQQWLVSKRAKNDKFVTPEGEKQEGKTLQRSGQLAVSIRIKATAKPGGIDIEIGSNKKYAMIHQFGGQINHPGGTPYITLGDGLIHFIKKAKAEKLKGKGLPVKYTKPHVITIPARPYLVIQDEDIQKINGYLLDHISKALS